MKNVTDPKVSFNSVNAESDLHLSNTAKNSAKFITKHKSLFYSSLSRKYYENCY